MSDDAAIRRANLQLSGVTNADLCSKVGHGPSYWSNLRTDPKKSFGEKIARKIEDGMGWPRGWLDTPQDKTPRAAEGWTYQQAQHLSLTTSNMVPHLEWEELMTAALPRKFEVTLPDDSMAPRAKSGQLVTLQSDLTPQPGDGVLVSDAHGNHFLRIYRQRRPGHWEAHATNEAYQALDSERDGLTVLAVLVGVQARWA